MFGNSALTLDVTEGADGELSAAMMRYWVAFAAGGDPNGAAEGANSAGASAPSDASSDAALPVWPLYDPATDQCLVLDREIGAAPAPYRRACDLADRLRAARGALRQVQVSRGVNNDR